jgi:crotonobetainyl-CoA:carnitine CoA-transferase CaiB-like acyl-CoA transferase
VPCAPVNNLQQMMQHDQTQALGIIQRVGADKAAMDQVMLPVSFDGARPEFTFEAPDLGEHSDLIFPETAK